MDEEIFKVLLERVKPHVQPTEVRHPLHWTYALTSKLLITLNL
jgi:hypothetical protein